MKSVLKVLTPASCNDLTVLDKAKAHLGIASGDVSKDVAIQDWIKRGSDAIANRCGRVFGLEVLTETMMLDRSAEALVTRRYPVKASPVPVVTVDGVELVSTDFIFDESHGIFYRIQDGKRVDWSGSTIKIDYSAGYNLLPELPFALEQACLLQVALYSSTGSRDPFAKRIEIPGVETVDYWVGSQSDDPGALVPAAETLIAPFMDYRVG